jgi:hypothetical protein
MKEFELRAGEHIVWEARRHWFLFLAELLPYAIFLVIPFALPKLLPLLPDLIPYVGSLDYSSPLARAGLGVWLLIFWTSAWSAFTTYFLDVWILTNMRIVFADQRTLFSREVSGLPLSRVQDVTITVTGVVSSLLGIGTIKVQSAGSSHTEFEMRGIPRPEQMRDLILRYVAEDTKNHKHT